MKISVVSGYFAPLHRGHIDLIRSAKKRSDKLIVVLNNDYQQTLKKGKIIVHLDERLEILKELKSVDAIMVALDKDRSVCKSLKQIAELERANNPECEIFFCNGGDRNCGNIPELAICREHSIQIIDGVGGNLKINSSTDINKLLGVE